MTRIYYDFLSGNGDEDCCCRCPHFHRDFRRKIQQECWNPNLKKTIKGIRWNERKRREIIGCQTPEWCPLPKLKFPPDALEVIGVEPIFRYKKSKKGIIPKGTFWINRVPID